MSITKKDNSNWPAIFYVPHADDDAIGMAAGIAEHKASGRPVYVVLIASGHNDGLLKIMHGEVDCPLNGWPGWEGHAKKHNFKQITSDQIDEFRREEFNRSVKELGVDKVFYGKDGKCIYDPLFYTDYYTAVDQVKAIINRYATDYPTASHKFVSGSRDKFPDINRTHRAIYDAAVQCHIENPNLKDCRFYRIYVYWNNINPVYSHTDFVFFNEQDWQDKKRKALNCYKEYNPRENKYALGYHSVPDLIDNAYKSYKTYIDLLPEEINIYNKPIILQAHNGFYLTQESDNYIYTSGDWIKDKQEFMLLFNCTYEGEDLFRLIAVGQPDERKYLSINISDGSIFLSNKPSEFVIKNTGRNKIALLEYYLRTYWHASDSKAVKLSANSKKIGEWETFTVFNKHSDCRISSVSANGQLYVFAREANNDLIWKTYNGISWSEWGVLGENILSEPKAVTYIHPRYGHIISVFAKQSNMKLQYKSFVRGYWTDWFTTNYTITSNPEVVICKETPHVFARGEKSDIYLHLRQEREWIDINLYLGNNTPILSDIKVINIYNNNSMRICARLKDAKNSFYFRDFRDNKWDDWITISDSKNDIVSDPDVAVIDNKSYIFVRCSDGYLWYLRTDKLFEPWQKTPYQIASAPKVVVRGNNIYVFAQKTNSMELGCFKWDGMNWSREELNNKYKTSSDCEVLIHNDKIHYFVRGGEDDLYPENITSGVIHGWENNNGWYVEYLGEQII